MTENRREREEELGGGGGERKGKRREKKKICLGKNTTKSKDKWKSGVISATRITDKG